MELARVASTQSDHFDLMASATEVAQKLPVMEKIANVLEDDVQALEDAFGGFRAGRVKKGDLNIAMFDVTGRINGSMAAGREAFERVRLIAAGAGVAVGEYPSR